MYVHWLDEIKEFCFNVTHLPGSQNPTDQLSRRGFEDGDSQAGSTGEQYQESQQELFSRLVRDAPCTADPGGACSRSGRVGRDLPDCIGLVRRRSGRGRDPLHEAQGGEGIPPVY